MARYIDADAAEKQIVDYYDAQLQSFPSSKGEEKRLLLGGINYGRNVVRDAPTADVVPKSEVERLERILNSYALQYGTAKDQQAVIDKAKSEVAREIFEEIEKELDTFDGSWANTVIATQYLIAELKKKYKEGANDQKKD